MARQDPQVSALQEELADAEAQIEALQSATADAEARAATAQAELAEARQHASWLEAELSAAREELVAAQDAEAESAEAKARLVEARDQLVGARAQLRDAALKYREARLAAAPHIPPDLVPGETLEEIDQQMEAAQRVVSQLRDRLRQEDQGSRVPIGAPPRRPPDLSGLPAVEKIKLGLQQLGEREGR